MPDLSSFWPIIAAFVALVAAGFGVPIPEELPTIGAGIWVASNPDLGPARWLILPACYVGVLISDVLLYGIGRLWGPRLLEQRWVTHFMKPETRERTETVTSYTQYLPQDGVKTPLSIVRTRNDRKIAQTFLTSCKYNSSLAPDLFTRASLEQRAPDVAKKGYKDKDSKNSK